MGVRLSQIKGDLRTVVISFGDDGDLTITYRPGVLTPAREEELASTPAAVRPLVELLAEMITDWDLLDDDGTPLPLDADQLMHTIPSDVFVRIFEAFKAESPGEANGGT